MNVSVVDGLGNNCFQILKKYPNEPAPSPPRFLKSLIRRPFGGLRQGEEVALVQGSKGQAAGSPGEGGGDGEQGSGEQRLLEWSLLGAQSQLTRGVLAPPCGQLWVLRLTHRLLG